MKVIVAGSREFKDKELFEKTMDDILMWEWPEMVAIVSGCAKGPDTWAIDWAKRNCMFPIKLPVEDYLWYHFGKSAGPMRNELMAGIGDALVAFSHKNSRGTRSMIYAAKRVGIPIRIVHSLSDSAHTAQDERKGRGGR